MTKQELRSVYKEKRRGLSDHDIEKFNDLILIQFQKSDLPYIGCVHTYLASLKLGEADTAKIVRYLQFQNPSLQVVVPKVDIHSGTMTHHHLGEESEMIENVFGIQEPVTGIPIAEEEIDMVLIPLLAFDQKGFRVGYGKGYYDKFLSRCRKDVIKVGLSFFDPVPKIDDIDSFDISLNLCVTPHQLYLF